MNRLVCAIAFLSFTTSVAVSDPGAGPNFVQQTIHGDLVKDSDTAISIVQVVIKSNFGDEVLREQQPLTALDGGDDWLVEGSFNKSRPVEGPGKIIAKLRKRDAGITSLIFDYVMLPPATLHR